jgi:hypothetical protein
VAVSPASQAATIGTTTVSGVDSTGIITVSKRGMPLLTASVRMWANGPGRSVWFAASRRLSTV